jgi:hypothetical protein
MTQRLTYFKQNPNRSSSTMEVQPTRDPVPAALEPTALSRVRSGDGGLTVWGEIDSVRGEITFHWENNSPGQTVLVFRVQSGKVPEYALSPKELSYTDNWTSGERHHSITTQVRHGTEANFVFETRQDISFIEQVFSFHRQPESRYMNLVHMHVRMPEKPNDTELRDIDHATTKAKKQAEFERARKELEAETAPVPDRMSEYMEVIEADLCMLETMDHLDDRIRRYEQAKCAAINADQSLTPEIRKERIRSIQIRVLQFRNKHGV